MVQAKPSSFIRSFFSLLGENRYTLLFGSLLLTIGGGEILAELNLSWGLNILIILNLLVLLSIGRGRVYFWVGLALFSLTLISAFLAAFYDFKLLVLGSQSSSLALLIMGTQFCFQAAFSRGRDVDRERISASISLYLMFGLIFALIFALVEKLLPGSFFYSILSSDGFDQKPLLHFMYFSYVTLATLGYGDIVPISGPAKGLALLEAIIGQLYLVLVVARLVSLYGKSESKESQ